MKLDIEGYEEVVLKELAAALPAGHEVAIIFENWNPSLDVDRLLSSFNRCGQYFRLASSVQQAKSSILKALRTLMFGRTYQLKATSATWVGDIVFLISA